MQFIDTYEKLPFVFSGNVTTLRLEQIDAGEYVDFTLRIWTVGFRGTETISKNDFSLPVREEKIYNGPILRIVRYIDLNLKEILNGAGRFLTPSVYGQMVNADISATLNEETASWSKKLIFGECAPADEERLMNGKTWWTKRPQLSKTFLHGTENLYFFLVGETAVYVTIYFRLNLPVKLLISRYEGKPDIGNKPRSDFGIIDCSYSYISRLAEESGYTDEILAYDVFIDGNESDAQRFIVKDDSSVSEFRFRNSFGLYDYIYASGVVSEQIEHNTKTFVSAGKETELISDSKHLFKTNTGYISSRDEAAFWREFIKSDERYILDGDGEWREIILDETDNECKAFELGEMSFKWHFAEHKPSGLPLRHELKPYIFKCNGISEL